MSNYKISRRNFISSSGVVFTLPLLESLFPFSKAMAQAANDPKRYVIYYYPNGTYNRPDRPIWATKDGTLSGANTSLALSPFSAYYPDLISINNLKNDAWFQTLKSVANDEHAAQAAAYLTCAGAINSSVSSFEHVIAAKVGKPALVLSGGITSADLPADRYISYKNGVGNAGLGNPGDLYRQLLKQVVPSTGGGTSPTPTPTPTPQATATPNPTPVPVNNNKSILDSAIADFNALNGKLGKADRAKMDEFLTAVRELEGKVATTTPTTPTTPTMPSGTPTPTPTPNMPTMSGSACVKPTINPAVDNTNYKDNVLYLSKFYAFNDMIKIAFACDITRSVSVMMDTETSQRTFASAPSHLIHNGANISGGYGSHTAISHGTVQTANGYNQAVTRDRVLFNVAMDLMNKLKASNDPSGSRMFDNTIIQTGFGVQDGNHGLHKDQRPLVLAVGRNMMSGGKSYTLNGNQFKDLYFTIATKMGISLGNYQGSSKIITL